MELPREVEELMALAVGEAIAAEAEAVEPLHLFIAVCKQETAAVIHAFAKGRINDLKSLRRRVRAYAHELSEKKEGGPQRFSGRVLRILDYARLLSINTGHPLDAHCVLLALLEHPDQALLLALETERLPVEKLIKHLREPGASGEQTAGADAEAHAPAGERSSTPVLDRYGKDYTALARAGKLDPVIGRRNEIKQVARILLQKQKNNPVLIGDAGVGKTSIVEGLALRIITEDAPAEIRDMRLVEVALSSLVAGTKFRGEFEERLQELIEEVEANPHVVIFIDEIHTLIGAGSAEGTLDAANILKPALARGRLRCIGATTTAEYRRHIEKDSALERRFQPVRVEEPTRNEACEILYGLRSAYEAHHNVEISDEAVEASVDLSIKYLPDRRLPDKARDLIDQAAVRKRFSTFSPRNLNDEVRERVTREDVAGVLADWAGIPVERLDAEQQARLLKMEHSLRRRVIGQEEALAAVSNVVRTALSGLAGLTARPHGVFLFTGPTGVGKTELAKALAEFLFGDEKRLLRFDMSEYMEEHSVSRLVGAPPGYVGHEEGALLTDAVRRMPYCVLLFDEIEKAHPRVADLFLQIFDDGRLTDSQGRTADFRNAIIILTTNLGNEPTRRPIPGFRPVREEFAEAGVWQGQRRDERSPVEHRSVDEVRHFLRAHFRPELLNRLSQIIQFRPLNLADLRAITEKLIAQVQQRLSERQVALHISPAAYDALIEIGYKPEWGAREMERVIEQQIVHPLAQGMLKGHFKAGDIVEVSPAHRGLKLSAKIAPG